MLAHAAGTSALWPMLPGVGSRPRQAHVERLRSGSMHWYSIMKRLRIPVVDPPPQDDTQSSPTLQK